MKPLFFILYSTMAVVTQIRCADQKNNSDTSTFLLCDTARRSYRSAGYEDKDIYTLKQTESNLKVCGRSRTCCKAHAEKNLVKSSEERRQFITSPLQKELVKTFDHTRSGLVTLFRSMITKSLQSLDSMFIKTYGVHYVNNTEVFKALYTNFHMYLNGSELDLQSSVDTFFSTLHQKLYVMTKPWLSFEKKYENCILESTNYVKPFGDTQRKIQVQVSRSFLASRVFLQGLKEGKEVIDALFHLPVHDGCSIAFMKMTQCSICSGISESTKPCSNYCVNVLKGCFAYIIMIQGKWNEFIKHMVILADKLEGPFSFEAIIEPLGLKISEAIMMFQENIQNITATVEERCGKLATFNSIGFGRQRRSADAKNTLQGLKTESEELLKKFVTDTSKVIKSESDSPSLSFIYNTDKNKKAPGDFETRLRAAKSAFNSLNDYWYLLPNKLCGMGVSADTNKNCWNGQNTTGYDLNVTGNSVPELFGKNPEMKLNPSQANVIIVNQARKLEAVIKRIKQIVTGDPRPCINSDDCPSPDSESGSGSGSGTGTVVPEEGSGSGELPTVTTTTDKCFNKVGEECYETIQTTAKPKNSINDNNVPGNDDTSINYIRPTSGRKVNEGNPNGNFGTVLVSNLFLIITSMVLTMF